MKRWIKRILLVGIVVLIFTTGVFLWWANNPLQAMPEAKQALVSNQIVQVTTGDWMVFSPVANSVESGIIFYPGAHLDPVAYAPLARKLAAGGYLVIIPKMPMNLAILDIHVANDIIRANPDIQKWAIGGHSLGGAMAAEFVTANPTAVKGLFLWAAYSAKKTDLSKLAEIRVLSVFGSEDYTIKKIRASRERLPQNTLWTEIEGANHGQFGWYGEHPGDGVATISREKQQEIVLENTFEFLNALTNNEYNQ
jgi:dienelactone hydrolase